MLDGQGVAVRAKPHRRRWCITTRLLRYFAPRADTHVCILSPLFAGAPRATCPLPSVLLIALIALASDQIWGHARNQQGGGMKVAERRIGEKKGAQLIERSSSCRKINRR